MLAKISAVIQTVKNYIVAHWHSALAGIVVGWAHSSIVLGISKLIGLL